MNKKQMKKLAKIYHIKWKKLKRFMKEIDWKNGL